MLDELIELLADIQHLIWSHWMRYLFSVCEKQPDGTYMIPVGLVERWQRQMQMQYDELSEEEKSSDRNEAMKIITFFRIKLSG